MAVSNPLGGGTAVLRHPVAGELRLSREKLPVSGTSGQLLVIHRAQPGSDSARALATLGGAQQETGDVSGPAGAASAASPSRTARSRTARTR